MQHYVKTWQKTTRAVESCLTMQNLIVQGSEYLKLKVTSPWADSTCSADIFWQGPETLSGPTRLFSWQDVFLVRARNVTYRNSFSTKIVIPCMFEWGCKTLQLSEVPTRIHTRETSSTSRPRARCWWHHHWWFSLGPCTATQKVYDFWKLCNSWLFAKH